MCKEKKKTKHLLGATINDILKIKSRDKLKALGINSDNVLYYIADKNMVLSDFVITQLNSDNPKDFTININEKTLKFIQESGFKGDIKDVTDIYIPFECLELIKRKSVKDNPFNFEGFRMLCQSPCDELYMWLRKELEPIYDKKNIYSSEDRWLFFKGDSPVCLCAHLDTVHSSLVSKFFVEPSEMIITSPQGIGGDDRCGVWIILQAIKDSIEEGRGLPNLFFSTDEEKGSVSTKIGCSYLKDNYPNVMDNIRFFVQLDRRNEKDSVYYNCDNKEFETFINSYGFETARGSRTDICILCEEWDKAGVNLSCGFEGEHHTTEYVNVNTMLNTTDKLIRILNDADDTIYTYSPKVTTYSKFNCNSVSESQYNNYGHC